MNLMVKRCEYKYLIDACRASVIRSQLTPFMTVDGHSAGRGYLVRSLYFDTPNGLDLQEKLDGMNIGKKVRIRLYHPDDPTCKLELKSKEGIYRQKLSVSVTRDEVRALTLGDCSCLLARGDEAAFSLYAVMTMGAYRPAALIEYDRAALMVDLNDTRITFDSGVRAMEYCPDALFMRDPPYAYCGGDEVIMEVKFNGELPYYLSKILGRHKLHQISVSKYSLGRVHAEQFIYGA